MTCRDTHRILPLWEGPNTQIWFRFWSLVRFSATREQHLLPCKSGRHLVTSYDFQWTSVWITHGCLMVKRSASVHHLLFTVRHVVTSKISRALLLCRCSDWEVLSSLPDHAISWSSHDAAREIRRSTVQCEWRLRYLHLRLLYRVCKITDLLFSRLVTAHVMCFSSGPAGFLSKICEKNMASHTDVSCESLQEYLGPALVDKGLKSGLLYSLPQSQNTSTLLRNVHIAGRWVAWLFSWFCDHSMEPPSPLAGEGTFGILMDVKYGHLEINEDETRWCGVS